MIYTLYLVDNNSNITETISLDVINSFGEDYSSSIAQNTVESGYVISDSISISNPKFSIGGVITDSKFRVKGHLVVFNGNSFVKSQGDNKEQFQQISDDDYAEKVKARLIKLWENKEIFGILESTEINNIKGTKVRNIFPCVLSSLSFNKSDSASAIYPSMSIEKIRYSVVTVSTVKDPIPELIPKYKESVEAQSKTGEGGAKTKSDDALGDPAAEAKKLLGNVSGQETTKKPAKKADLLTLNVTAQSDAQAWFNSFPAKTTKAGEVSRESLIAQYGSERAAKAAQGKIYFDALLTGHGYAKGSATYDPR